MNRIRDLIADLTRLFAGLNKRERMLVSLAGVTAVVFIGSIMFSSVRSSIDRHELSIQDKTLALQQVAVFAQSFTENERARREIETRLGGTPVRLITLLQDLASKNGLTIGSISERGENMDGQVKESLVEVSIASAPIDKLTAVLNELERNPRPVKIRKLRTRRNSADETLNVTLTVASYQLVKGS